MKSYILYIIALMVLLGCSSHQTPHSEHSKIIKAAKGTADFPQMIQDQHGNVVAWWVEKDNTTGEPFVYFSRSNKTDLDFNKSHEIAGTRNISAGGQRMPKLVIKPDGTYILIFARLNENSNAPFAGSILYTQSFDEGNTWTKPELIHSDSNPDNSHSFPDAILLPDGEVGAVWLDGRHHLDHSEIYFAKTNGRKGFEEDKTIGGPSCECCKLDMYVDHNKTLHLAYRSHLKDNIRDIMHISSSNDGDNFSSPSRVSPDNWQIMACPHNGPSITTVENQLYAAWYTQGGGKGLYYAKSKKNGSDFSSRKRLATSGNHVYLTSFNHSVLAVWDEIYQKDDKAYTRIKMARISEDGQINAKYLSPENVEAATPYPLKMRNGNVVVSWTQKSKNGNEIRFTNLIN